MEGAHRGASQGGAGETQRDEIIGRRLKAAARRTKHSEACSKPNQTSEKMEKASHLDLGDRTLVIRGVREKFLAELVGGGGGLG